MNKLAAIFMAVLTAIVVAVLIWAATTFIELFEAGVHLLELLSTK